MTIQQETTDLLIQARRSRRSIHRGHAPGDDTHHRQDHRAGRRAEESRGDDRRCPQGLPRVANGPRSPARRARSSPRRRAPRRARISRPPRHHRGRKDPLRRHRRSAGDDRYLRLRHWPLAPARRSHHRLRAARAPHDGDLAPARSRWRHLRLQLSRRRLGVERRSCASLR